MFLNLLTEAMETQTQVDYSAIDLDIHSPTNNKSGESVITVSVPKPKLGLVTEELSKPDQSKEANRVPSLDLPKDSAVTASSAGFMDKSVPGQSPPNADVINLFSASPATRLKRRLLDTKDLIVCPGVYDGLSARIALSVGCDAMYMVSSSHIKNVSLLIEF